MSQEKPINLVSSLGFYSSDQGHHLMNQMQSFESNPELFNLTSGIEMLGFPSKNHGNNNSIMWKGFFGKTGNYKGSSSSSSKIINESSSEFYQPSEFNKPDFSTGFSQTNDDLIAPPESAWPENRFPIDDSSLRCVFPCEGNERPSQGLSLSLSSTKPSGIGLQSFELRNTSHQHQEEDGFFGKSSNIHHDQVLQEGFHGKASNLHQTQFQLKNSRYLVPTQELLNEFCKLGTKQSADPPKKISRKTCQWEDENGGSSSRKHSFYSLDLLELQRRKTKLLSMLEEVDRRYRQYCDQMKAVVSSFEAVAGIGSSIVYSALASKAMSRHFRCLRDGIVGQIQEIKKALGEKDIVAPGASRGDTPRLRVLDQTLRQQKAFQQMTMMETHPWRPQRGLPERSVTVLRAWLFEHFLHPYPSDVDKHILARQTGLSRSQVSNWFINARVRLWKPMVEEMYLEETKEQDNIGSSGEGKSLDDNGRRQPKQNPQGYSGDQKPTLDQLIHGDSESLSSIIINKNNNPDKNNSRNARNNEQFGRIAEPFGVVDLDFSNVRQNFGNGVSLTLGLQQHEGNGVNLSFSSPPLQNSLFFPRDHIEDCQAVQYSILDGEAQNLPYRNLMGAQLLHDFAG